jgi:ATP-binding cassette subfamily B (MDR/TAP) protein 1
MGAFLMLYVMLTMYGSFVLYSAVRETGCDPSGGVEGNTTYAVSGVDIFGTFTAISFAGMGLPQVAVYLEAIANARSE